MREVRFAGASAVDDLCASLLEARRIAESDGRLDFAVAVTFAGTGEAARATARLTWGSAHAVGRITFTGHTTVNDATLRRALLLRERELFDVGKLRRSLARIDDTGFFEPLTLADVTVARRDDGVTADVTIALRERRRRWWSLSGPMLPGVGSLQASISSRLPPWGRGVFEASTYVIGLNLLGFVTPVQRLFPLVLERPVLPGQEWLSGFAISPTLSPRAALTHYGRAHLMRGVRAVLDGGSTDVLRIPVARRREPDAEVIVCHPPKPRLRWLRRAGTVAAEVGVRALMP